MPGGLTLADDAVLRVPTLAIHLDRQENFSFNKETQLFPIAGLIAEELNKTGGEPATNGVADGFSPPLLCGAHRS